MKLGFRLALHLIPLIPISHTSHGIHKAWVDSFCLRFSNIDVRSKTEPADRLLLVNTEHLRQKKRSEPKTKQKALFFAAHNILVQKHVFCFYQQIDYLSNTTQSCVWKLPRDAQSCMICRSRPAMWRCSKQRPYIFQSKWTRWPRCRPFMWRTFA